MSAGAPRVILHGLVLLSPMVVAGGEVHVDNCTFANSSADSGGALLVTAGMLTAKATAFVGCSARRGGGRGGGRGR